MKKWKEDVFLAIEIILSSSLAVVMRGLPDPFLLLTAPLSALSLTTYPVNCAFGSAKGG